jgi:hypothetical protein
MFSEDRIPSESLSLWNQCQELLNTLLIDAPIKTADLKIPGQTLLDFNQHRSLYRIKDGMLKEYFNQILYVTYEPGDLVGITNMANGVHSTMTTDFAIVVDEYDINQFLTHLAQAPEQLREWNQYLAGMLQSLQYMVCSYKKDDVEFQPEIRQYSRGEKIIKQGQTDNEVFTLISGLARVMVEGTPVGEVIPNEIFGAIAALTATTRTADVIAETDCTVMIVPSERFQTLLANRPETVTKLIEDMARNIISGNEQIVSLSKT